MFNNIKKNIFNDVENLEKKIILDFCNNDRFGEKTDFGESPNDEIIVEIVETKNPEIAETPEIVPLAPEVVQPEIVTKKPEKPQKPELKSGRENNKPETLRSSTESGATKILFETFWILIIFMVL
mgnify:CR=1 FL=1